MMMNQTAQVVPARRAVGKSIIDRRTPDRADELSQLDRGRGAHADSIVLTAL
jgi:hypothetical protein